MPNINILIAENDIDDRFLLRTAFEECCFNDTLHFVENGVELLGFLLRLKSGLLEIPIPQFILLDLNMPKKDGKEVLKEIKQDDFLKQIPIIVFSTTANENERKKCFELGAHSYLKKPISFEGLMDIVTELHNYWAV